MTDNQDCLRTINSKILNPVLTFNYEELKYIYKQNDVNKLKKIIEQVNILDNPSRDIFYDLIFVYESDCHQCGIKNFVINHAKSKMLQLIVENITDNLVESIHYNLNNFINRVPDEFIELLRIKFNKFKIFEKNFSMT